MKPPDIRLTAKILNTMAIIAAKPPSHPLFHAFKQAELTKPRAHKVPLNAFFLSCHADFFEKFLELQQPDPTAPLQPTPRFGTLLLPDKDTSITATQALKASNLHTIVYLDGSRIPGKNTAASAWCENNKHQVALQLGKADEYGIFEAEFVGFVLALKIAKRSYLATTRQITLIFDNQGAVKDMATKKTSSRALLHKKEALEVIKDIQDSAPELKLTLRWCPGHRGIPGSEHVDKLANTTARAALPPNHVGKPTLASFKAAIKDWSKKATINSYTQQDVKRLGHQPHPKEHLNAIAKLKNKHSVATISQLRSGHIPLYQYLASRNLRTDCQP